MAQQNSISMPGLFGGLMRYDEEYNSRFVMGPGHVIAFTILIIILVIVLNVFWPVKIAV